MKKKLQQLFCDHEWMHFDYFYKQMGMDIPKDKLLKRCHKCEKMKWFKKEGY